MTLGLYLFNWKKHKIFLVDTPGHIDFRVQIHQFFEVIKSALLIVSAREGMESSTIQIIGDMLQQKVSPILFINKLDLEKVAISDLLQQIEKVLTDRFFLMTLPIYNQHKLRGVIDIFNGKAIYTDRFNPKDVKVAPIPYELQDICQQWYQRLVDVATIGDPNLTEDALNQNLTPALLLQGLQKAVVQKNILPYLWVLLLKISGFGNC